MELLCQWKEYLLHPQLLTVESSIAVCAVTSAADIFPLELHLEQQALRRQDR